MNKKPDKCLETTQVRVCPYWGNHCLCGDGPCSSPPFNWGLWKPPQKTTDAEREKNNA